MRAIAATFAAGSTSRAQLLKLARQWDRIADGRETVSQMWSALGRARPEPQPRRSMLRAALLPASRRVLGQR